MAFARTLRLAPVLALVASAVSVAPSTAATWPGSDGDIFAVSGRGTAGTIARFSPSGNPRGTVGSDLTEFSSFSLDAGGNRLAYSKDGEIVIVDLESMEETQITESPATDRDPTFSFDGRYLVWVSADANDSEIFMWDLTDPSSPTINLTNNTADDWAPAFGNNGTGHGDLIAYVSLEGGTDSDIWTMTPGGTDKTNLTASDPTDNFGPNWHPGFDMLAYSGRDAEDRDQIFTMSWDGTGKDQLTNDDNYNYEPAWSPEGTHLVFTKQGRAVGAIPRLYIRPGTPGGTETPLTPAGDTGYDRAEWQAMPSGCQQDCEPPEELQPVVFMTLKKHVVVSGRVEGTAGVQGGICGVDNPMQIQRYSKGQFRPVANVTTNQDGTFSRKVPDRTGRYRVVSFEFTDEANGTKCLAATSPAKVHRHR